MKAAIDFFIYTFTELVLLFYIISLLVSYINLKVPKQRVSAILSGSKGYGVAFLLGAVTPFCSCSTLPMVRGLLQAKAAFGPVMTFLFTSPLINPFIIVLFTSTFGLAVTLFYLFMVVTLAITAGQLMAYFSFDRFVLDEVGNANCQAGAKAATVSNSVSFKLLMVDGAKQLLQFLPYIVLGVAVGAVVHGFVPTEFFTQLASQPDWLVIPLAGFIGVFLYVRAATMIPVATALIAKGLSLGATISLTIGGAGASLPEMIMMKKLFKLPLIFAFLFVVFFTATSTGVFINLFF